MHTKRDRIHKETGIRSRFYLSERTGIFLEAVIVVNITEGRACGHPEATDTAREVNLAQGERELFIGVGKDSAEGVKNARCAEAVGIFVVRT